MTQEQAVLKYIKDFGSITSMQAFADLGVTRLSAKIFDLKKKGYMFDDTTVVGVNRYGNPMHYKKYKLMELDIIDDIVKKGKVFKEQYVEKEGETLWEAYTKFIEV